MKKTKFILWLGAFILLIMVHFCYAQDNGYRSSVEEALNSIEGELEPSIQDEQPLEPSVSVKEEETVAPSVVETKKITPEPTEEDKKPIIIDVLELKDMDIGDVLKLVSKKSGLNIVKGQNVKGKITIYLKNVDVRDALRIILESNAFAYVEEGGIIRVMTAKDYELTYGHKFGKKTEIRIAQLQYASAEDIIPILTVVKSIVGKVIADGKSNTLVLIDTPETLDAMERLIKEVDVPIETKVFDLSYAQAEEIASKISETLTKNVGNVKFDTRSNKVIVTDTAQKLGKIEKIIEAFDVQHKEVSVEAKIIQITLSDQYKMGVDWQAIVSDFHTLTLTTDFDKLSAIDKGGKLSIGTISADDYTVLLEALDTVGKSEILSNPHITVINNEEAKILVGSTEPYVTTTTTTPAAGATTTAESVNFIDVGVKLFVTPTIHNDGYITMKIKPEVSSVTRFLTTSNNNTIPVVESSEAETIVMVKDGTTIVIGGLIKNETIETVNKIPLLGDIPFLGAVFRNTDSLVRKTETVIFLTPHIVSGDFRDNTFVDRY